MELWLTIFSLLLSDVPNQQHIETSTQAVQNESGWAYASFYGKEVCGDRYGTTACHTANQEVFDEQALTLACNPRFKIGQRFLFSYKEKEISATCNDRGGFYQFNEGERLFDFSKGLFEGFEKRERGVIYVHYEAINN